MDVQTAWNAIRSLGVGVALLVHAASNQMPMPAPHVQDLQEAYAEALARHLPHGMSVELYLLNITR